MSQFPSHPSLAVLPLSFLPARPAFSPKVPIMVLQKRQPGNTDGRRKAKRHDFLYPVVFELGELDKKAKEAATFRREEKSASKTLGRPSGCISVIELPRISVVRRIK